jgi:prolyl-tRNA editing enzyme YbaK/EbsC (Cys-tRNA(Pro) deacylase)
MSNQATLLHDAVQEALQKYGLQYEVMECDPNLADTAVFCEHYKLSPDQTCNCIIASSKTDPVQYACCLILATQKLDVNKRVRSLLNVKRCSFASAEQTLELTGMIIGGVTPVGLPDVPIYVDALIMQTEKIILGGGNRSSKLIIHPTELMKLPRVQVVESLGIPR